MFVSCVAAILFSFAQVSAQLEYCSTPTLPAVLQFSQNLRQHAQEAAVEATTVETCPTKQKVIFIGVDGLRADAAAMLPLANIHRIASMGVFSTWATVQHLGSAVSGPGWTAILTGVEPEKHMVDGNSDLHEIHPEYPTFLKRAKFELNKTVAATATWSPLVTQTLAAEGGEEYLDGSSVGHNDVGTTAVVVDWLTNQDYDVIFVQLDEVDGAGHGSRFDGYHAPYANKVIETDALIGEILDALEARATVNEEEWLIVVTTDHGGLGSSHGPYNDENRRIPLLVGSNSPRVGLWNYPANGDFGSHMDVLPTIMHFLGVEIATYGGVLDGQPFGFLDYVRTDPPPLPTMAPTVPPTPYPTSVCDSQLFFEDWESLASSLGPLVSASESGGDGTDWTANPPSGWMVSTGATPIGGPIEFFGWTFFDWDTWVKTAGDQQRVTYTLGSGVIAVADPDEYDDLDLTISPDLYQTTLTSPAIDISQVGIGEVITIQFDSSWRPEDTQEVAFRVLIDEVSMDLFRWTSGPQDVTFKDNAPNEHVRLEITKDTEAYSLQLVFDMPAAGNDWWWAVDNIGVSACIGSQQNVDTPVAAPASMAMPTAPVVSSPSTVTEDNSCSLTLFAEDFESITDLLLPLQSPTEAGGDGTDWSPNGPTGWTVDYGSTPEGGPAEFYGWTFIDYRAWIVTAEDQDRGLFDQASGVIAVADPDEYDDGVVDIDPDLFSSTLYSPAFDISSVNPGEAILVEFASSWRPEDAQEVTFLVKLGADTTELFHWTSTPGDADFKPDSTNEEIMIEVVKASNSQTEMQLIFEMNKAGNDWWWAVDNIHVHTISCQQTAEVPTTAPVTMTSVAAGTTTETVTTPAPVEAPVTQETNRCVRMRQI